MEILGDRTMERKFSSLPSGSFGAGWLCATTVLILLVAVVYAFYIAFTRPLSLDEGFLMITVQSFLEGQPLYDSVFTQYGPVYYAYEWIVHRAVSVPLTHDATRLLSIFHWLVAAALLGLAGRRITGSAIAGLFVFMQAVVHLAPLANEPGHPQELIATLLATGLLVASGPVNKSRTLAILAAIAIALFFTKINVGIFFAVALGLAMLWQAPNRFAQGTMAWLLIASCAILPFLLMRRFIIYDWCRNYALLVAATSIAASITAKDRTPGAFGRRPWLTVSAASIVTAIAWVAIALLAGTSWRAFIDGVVLIPLRLVAAAVWPLQTPTFALLSPAGSLVLAAFLSVNPKHLRRAHIITLFKVLFGIATLVFMAGSHIQLQYLLPWMWLVIIPSAMEQAHRENFARAFLAFAAVWQSLQAYPIAGTQVAIATLFIPVAGIVCLVDALRRLRGSELILSRIARCQPATALIAKAAAAAAVLGFFTLVSCNLPAARRHYATLPALDLPGSRLIRADASTVRSYQALAHYLEANCDTFLTSPGMNSFYFWARKQPPTHLNVTTFSILTKQQEEQVVTALNRASRPLIVAIEGTITPAPANAGLPLRPFMRVLRDEYVEIHHIPPFKIYRPKNQAKSTRS
jgi:hypothetical protein